MSNLFVKYTGILAVICGVSVGLVAAANEGTKDTIAKKHEADTRAAYKVVLPALGNLKKLPAPGGLITDVQESSKNGKRVHLHRNPQWVWRQAHPDGGDLQRRQQNHRHQGHEPQ